MGEELRVFVSLSIADSEFVVLCLASTWCVLGTMSEEEGSEVSVGLFGSQNLGFIRKI